LCRVERTFGPIRTLTTGSELFIQTLATASVLTVLVPPSQSYSPTPMPLSRRHSPRHAAGFVSLVAPGGNRRLCETLKNKGILTRSPAGTQPYLRAPPLPAGWPWLCYAPVPPGLPAGRPDRTGSLKAWSPGLGSGELGLVPSSASRTTGQQEPIKAPLGSSFDLQCSAGRGARLPLPKSLLSSLSTLSPCTFLARDRNGMRLLLASSGAASPSLSSKQGTA